MGLKLRDYMLMLGMLITGSINTISKKIQLQCSAPGIDVLNSTVNPPPEHLFKKPWLQTMAMFIGECLCLVGFAFMRCKKQKKHKEFILSGSVAPESSLTRNSYLSWILIIPTICDLLGTTVQGYSLIFIDASVWQMMRGSLIIFVGILSMIFLKRVLRLFNWTGISISVIGLALVGLSSILKASPTPGGSEVISGSGSHKVLGILLVLLGSFISATQMVLEESLLKKKKFHPLQVVGSEGLIGLIITGFVVLPIVHNIKGTDHGSFENVIDGLYQISQNGLLAANLVLYVVSIAFYNYFGLSVARSLTAVHRTLIDALRTILVWFVNLFIFYVIGQKYGENFDKSYGLLQVDGFICLMIGTMIYNRVMNLDFIPICKFESEQPSNVDEENEVDQSKIHGSSINENLEENERDEFLNTEKTPLLRGEP